MNHAKDNPSLIIHESPAERLALALFVAAGVEGFVRNRLDPWAYVLLAPCVISVFWRFRIVSPGLIRMTRYAAWALSGFALWIAFAGGTWPTLLPDNVYRLSSIAGTMIAVGAAFTLLLPVPRTPEMIVLPLGLSLLLMTAVPYEARPYIPVILCGFALAFWLRVRAVVPASSSKRFHLPALRTFWQSGLTFGAAGFLAWFLPWLQPQVERTMAQYMNRMNSGFSSLDSECTLGEIEKLKLSRRIVLRVWTDRPQYLRGRAYLDFDGKRWAAPKTPGVLNALVRLSPAEPAPVADPGLARWLGDVPGLTHPLPGRNLEDASGPDAIKSRILLAVPMPRLLVTPGDKVLVRSDATDLRVDPAESVVVPHDDAGSAYAVVNRPAPHRATVPDLDPATRAAALTLPDDTDPRFTGLAARLSAGDPPPEERVRRTVRHLEAECRYSLEPGAFKSAQPTAEFLFETKRGYCAYFASAAAILLRAQGVPCRFLSGFHVGGVNAVGDHYVVRDLDAHAWVEAWLPGRGWTTVDPTPAAEYDALHAGDDPGWFDAAGEWIASRWATLWVRLRSGDWIGLAGRLIGWILDLLLRPAAAALLLVLAAAAWIRNRRRNNRATHRPGAGLPPPVAAILARLDREWARRGHPRPASRGLVEHLDAIPESALPGERRKFVRNLLDLLYRVIYGGLPHAAADSVQMGNLFDRAYK